MVYEKALRDCGYTGVAMYWNWVADSAAPSKAAVWHPVTGFGGNGVDTGDNGIRKRVIDGPFKDWRPAYWNDSPNPHWLSRDWSPAQFGEPELRGARYSPAEMATVNNNTVFDDFRRALENGPHAAVHGGVGAGGDNRGLGDMGLNNASPSGESFCTVIIHGRSD
jgi:tyrosinase